MQLSTLEAAGFCAVATKVNHITLCVPTGQSSQAANLAIYLLPMPETWQISLMPCVYVQTNILICNSCFCQGGKTNCSVIVRAKTLSGVHIHRNNSSNSVQKSVLIKKSQVYKYIGLCLTHNKMSKSEKNKHIYPQSFFLA